MTNESPSSSVSTTTDLLLDDRYADDRAPGHVVGSRLADGLVRRGADAEGVLAVDHGALRIGYMRRAGWGRHGLAYGPFQREGGLAFATLVLNGHNNSQTDPNPEPAPRRWARRLIRPFHPLLAPHRVPPRPPSPCLHPPLPDNLAAGWFAGERPLDPTADSHAFVVRATGGANGDLHVGVVGESPRVVSSLQNLPVLYVVILRERGAAYYAASLPGAPGTGAFPAMRPLAIDPAAGASTLYAGIWQSVLGEIGFQVDTRVFGSRVARPPGLAAWYGTAYAADMLTGTGPLEATPADRSAWRVVRGRFERHATGATAAADDSLALLLTGEPAGLVHAYVRPSAEPIGFAWRVRDAHHFWGVSIDTAACRLLCYEDGVPRDIATAGVDLPAGTEASLQVIDDGRRIDVLLDGRPLLAADDERFGQHGGVGLYAAKAAPASVVHHFEAHPRRVPVPEALRMIPPALPETGRPVVVDTFDAPAGPLEGHPASTGSGAWTKLLGAGVFELDGGTARVRASVDRPNPGRTAYAVPWPDPAFADVEVKILPPGTERGAGHRGRGGLVLWQDPAHYLIVNTWLDDCYDGTSISSFFFLGGREDVYRAVWTNVGRRVRWGVPYRLRLASDGLTYLVYVDDEPVLYRALSDVFPQAGRLAIRRVGIVANWEWGDDTGSRFLHFTGRTSDEHAERCRPFEHIEEISS